jgi:DNA-binding GntR family transcriptional regulator
MEFGILAPFLELEEESAMTSGARDRVVGTGLADEVAFRLQAAILDGEYPPGTHLNQDELCTRFGVSRTPVREALRKLQAQRLVDLIPNKGATVRTSTRAELVEVYVLRAELEGFAAQLAAERITDDALTRLEGAQEAAESAVAALESGVIDPRGDAQFDARIRAANETFHSVVNAAAGNTRLTQYVRDLQDVFPKDYVWRAVSSIHESRVLNLEEHAAISRALAAGDGATARKLMAAHIEHAGQLLIAYMDAHQTWG